MAEQLPLILASASPRRRELMSSMGLSFETYSTDADENVTGEGRRVVEILAERKARKAEEVFPGRWILAADTLVERDGRVLGKPRSHEDALLMLRLLSGGWHTVHTGVCLMRPDGAFQTRVCTTRVRFETLSEETILRYVRTGEPMGKAGGYAIQGMAGMFVTEIAGSFSNVIGLPTAMVRGMLSAFGYPGII